jgi:hypothetical protein
MDKRFSAERAGANDPVILFYHDNGAVADVCVLFGLILVLSQQ